MEFIDLHDTSGNFHHEIPKSTEFKKMFSVPAWDYDSVQNAAWLPLFLSATKALQKTMKVLNFYTSLDHKYDHSHD